MRGIVSACAGLLALTACGSLPTSPTADAPSHRVASPGSAVTAQFTITFDGAVVYRESGPGNNGKGTCVSGGRWYNPQNHHTSEQAHPQCASISAGATFTVVFDETATYVLPPSGNVQLNFAPDCTLSAANDCARGVQYKKNQDVTVGFGSLAPLDDEGRTWTIDLGQPLLNASGNLINPAGTILEACNAALGCFAGTMTW